MSETKRKRELARADRVLPGVWRLRGEAEAVPGSDPERWRLLPGARSL